MNKKGIQEIFSEVPHKYEAINHILTMGLDVLWRGKLAKLAAQRGGSRWIDLCSGTGDTACLLRKSSSDGVFIVSQDFSMPMLRKAMSKPQAKKISFCISDAIKLPFKDNSFDAATISFATRNINSGDGKLVEYFREFRRILKPGGVFLNLETTQPKSKIIRSLFHWYVGLAVRPLGSLISGSKTAYKYLSSTIPVFYGVEELSAILYEAGFNKVDFSYMTFGACAIHTAAK